MKIYQHIVNNRPFCYAVGKDSDLESDIKSFVAQAERVAGTKFKQLPDRCEDHLDYFAENGGSVVHVITISEDMIARNT